MRGAGPCAVEREGDRRRWSRPIAHADWPECRRARIEPRCDEASGAIVSQRRSELGTGSVADHGAIGRPARRERAFARDALGVDVAIGPRAKVLPGDERTTSSIWEREGGVLQVACGAN